MSAAPGATAPSSVDAEHPWLGLTSYTEETRAYFHGRDEEAAELARRVQRKNLTVLFGQSGLGKTSLLRAGLVPRLRGEGYCPVYVRVDYSPESPPPAEQIKQAIFRATAEAGHWTRPGTAVEGESLWEFLHHRGDLLRDAGGRTVLPLLIFDQFEEIFTLAQADDRGRLRAREFIEDLADLVENRPPLSLEERLDQDEAAAEDFDFARADYRILIALREDYLAHLEGLKGAMPSITQNRMRLARMTGAQALAAVLEPGGRLVSQDVAESIVRFVAGGSELANAEVEPSLLSLVCRELNNVRIAQGRQEISADLLAGSRETILSEFYERALADQPPGVRRVIEDELLTESGYRESLAEERVIKALAAAGAAPDALAKLVDRRLLRIEERLDVRRVELTHDVLCSVVGASRDLRHEREARDEAERQLAAQREREEETRRTLRRTRRFAVIAAGLMIVALAGAVFGWINYRRAHQADLTAQRARSDAEQLVGFLIEDFYEELEPTGRLDTLGKLAHRAVSYFDALPPGLMTPQTRVYRGMALIREGGALLAKDEITAGSRSIAEARQLFEQLRSEGSAGPAVDYGLALALFTPYAAWGAIGGPESRPTDLPRALELLEPLLGSKDYGRSAGILYADALNYLSHAQPPEEAIATCEKARQILRDLGATRLEDLTAAAVYADTADSQSRHSMQAGRLEDAAALAHEVYELSEGVLERRPADLRSMRNRALAADMLATVALRRHDFDTAEAQARRSQQAGEDLVRFNPTDANSWIHLLRGRANVEEVLFERGEINRAVEYQRATSRLSEDERWPNASFGLLEDTYYDLAYSEAELGRRAAAERALAAAAAASAEFAGQLPTDKPLRTLTLLREPLSRANLSLILGNAGAALEEATVRLSELEAMAIDPADGTAIEMWNNMRQWALLVITEAQLRLGRHADAEAAARRTLALPMFSFGDSQEQLMRRRTLLAHALAAQGKDAEARSELAPALEYYRSEQQAGANGTDYRLEFAAALYVGAIAQAGDAAGREARRRLLAEAGASLGGLSPEVRELRSYREIADWISEAGSAG